jgi:hypothetical protein
MRAPERERRALRFFGAPKKRAHARTYHFAPRGHLDAPCLAFAQPSERVPGVEVSRIVAVLRHCYWGCERLGERPFYLIAHRRIASPKGPLDEAPDELRVSCLVSCDSFERAPRTRVARHRQLLRGYERSDGLAHAPFVNGANGRLTQRRSRYGSANVERRRTDGAARESRRQSKANARVLDLVERRPLRPFE